MPSPQILRRISGGDPSAAVSAIAPAVSANILDLDMSSPVRSLMCDPSDRQAIAILALTLTQHNTGPPQVVDGRVSQPGLFAGMQTAPPAMVASPGGGGGGMFAGMNMSGSAPAAAPAAPAPSGIEDLMGGLLLGPDPTAMAPPQPQAVPPGANLLGDMEASQPASFDPLGLLDGPSLTVSGLSHTLPVRRPLTQADASDASD